VSKSGILTVSQQFLDRVGPRHPGRPGAVP
jgi:hypothetical protein